MIYYIICRSWAKFGTGVAGQPLQEEQVDFFYIVDHLFEMKGAVDFPYSLQEVDVKKDLDRIIVILDKDPDSDPDI